MAHFLRQHSKMLGTGTMRGRIFSLGDYPGAVHEPEATSTVNGDVFELKNNELVFKVLDEYEGIGEQFPEPYEYDRILCPIQLFGQEIQCWVYVWNPNSKGKTSAGKH